jgi:putative flavoprotein involved in K+ transport
MVCMNSFDVVVVGAGQAGLAMGYCLQKLGLNFVLLEKAQRVGDSWRNRYDSLTLFTPAEYDSLPGLNFPAPKGTSPTKNQVADYLERYAQHFALPVQLQTQIELLEKRGDVFYLETNRGAFAAARVIVATGPFQTPFIPSLAKPLDTSILQLHSSTYFNKQQLPDGEVLVVGSGNSGLQIAEELLASHSVTVAQGKSQPFLPQKLLGQSLFWWMERLGVSHVTTSSRLGQQLKERDPVIGSSLSKLRQKGLKLVSRVVEAEGQTVTFADGKTLKPRSIIWATGFRSDYSWVRLPVFDTQGKPIHQSGITSVEGFYFLGLSWQRTRGSALLGWVGQDAAFLVEEITKVISSRASNKQTRDLVPA